MNKNANEINQHIRQAIGIVLQYPSLAKYAVDHVGTVKVSNDKLLNMLIGISFANPGISTAKLVECWRHDANVFMFLCQTAAKELLIDKDELKLQLLKAVDYLRNSIK